MTNLNRLARDTPRLKDEVSKAVNAIKEISAQTDEMRNNKMEAARHSLMGWEGRISRYYFQTLKLFFPKDFYFEKRSRRPALDYFNAALNYLYGLTYTIVESGVFAKGLDPSIGMLHADQHQQPSLVFRLN